MERLVDVVREVGGIHAQVMGSAELQLAARVAGITQEHVRAALWMWRELAKTWTLRGTLHIHPADELRLWTAARRAVVGPADYDADSLEDVEIVVEAIGDALRGKRLLREELADAVAASVGAGAARAAGLGLGLLPGRRGDRRSALLRAAAGPEGHVRASGRLARSAALVRAGRRRCARSPGATSPPTVPSRTASSGSGSPLAASAPRRRRRSSRSSTSSRWTWKVTSRTCWRTRSRCHGRRRCACCRNTTST